MLTADDIKFLLKLPEDYASDDLDKYISIYKSKICAYIPDVDCETISQSPLFDEALLSGIACNLSMVNPELIYSPSEYKVGDTEEKYSDNLISQIPSWCGRYNSALEALLSEYTEIKNLRTFRRRGLSTNRRYHHDVPNYLR